MLTEHMKLGGGEMSLPVQREEKNLKALIPSPGSTHSTLHTGGIFRSPLLLNILPNLISEKLLCNSLSRAGDGLLFHKLAFDHRAGNLVQSQRPLLRTRRVKSPDSVVGKASVTASWEVEQLF